MRYTKSHEWVRVEGSTATIGITDHAQQLLGDVVFVELPEVDSTFEKGQAFGAVESVKAASDLYLPVGGQVVESNKDLEYVRTLFYLTVRSSPDLVNSEPYGKGWMTKIKITNPEEVAALMNAEAYDNFAKEDSH